MWKTLLKILIVFLGLDFLYLTLTRTLFGEMVARIQRTALQLRLIGGIVVYLLMTVGLYYFIVKPGRSCLDAGLLGLVIYGIFDFTNYAMFKNYDLSIAIMDMLWGGILFYLTSKIIRNL